MSWVTSPAATELEQHVLDWLADLLGLPGVVPLDRHRRRRGPGLELGRQPGRPARGAAPVQRRARTLRQGVEPERATVYVSAETHSSMEKAVRIAGLGSDAVRIVEVDGDLAMQPGGPGRPAGAGRRPRLHPRPRLRDGRDDVDDGRRSARRDRPDLPEVRRLAARRRRLRRGERRSCPSCARCRPAWSGPTATRPTRTSGCSPASTPPSSGSPTARRSPARWRSSRSTCATPPPTPAPSSTSATGRSPWAAGSAPSSCGSCCAGTAPRVCGPTSARTSRWRRSWPAGPTADERFDVVAPHPLSLVCLRPRWADDVDDDVATMTLLERLNDGGEVFLTHTTVGGRAVLRVAVGSPGDDARARRAGLDPAARGPRLAGRRLRRGRRGAGRRAGRRAGPRRSRAGRGRSGPRRGRGRAARAEAEQQQAASRADDPHDDATADGADRAVRGAADDRHPARRSTSRTRAEPVPSEH